MAKNTSVVLGEHFEAFVSKKIQEGEFQSVSEAVRSGLHMLEKEDARIRAFRAMLQEGLDSPVVEDFDADEFFQKFR